MPLVLLGAEIEGGGLGIRVLQGVLGLVELVVEGPGREGMAQRQEE